MIAQTLQAIDDGILHLKMNAPKKRNALSLAMISQLQNALDVAKDNAEIRVIVLSANGPGFCAGHDLKELTAARKNDDGGRNFYSKTMAACATLMQTIVNHPKPIIADIRGVATAAGCQLVASCDLAIASDKAQFATPGVNIGLFCSTPMVALSRNVSRKHAMEMLLTGDMISAQRAEQIGLINKVAKDSEMDKVVAILAGKIASKSTMTVKTGKLAFYKQAEMQLSQAYDYASQVMVDNMMQNDAREGIGAFVEKRQPEWTDS